MPTLSADAFKWETLSVALVIWKNISRGVSHLSSTNSTRRPQPLLVFSDILNDSQSGTEIYSGMQPLYCGIVLSTSLTLSSLSYYYSYQILMQIWSHSVILSNKVDSDILGAKSLNKRPTSYNKLLQSIMQDLTCLDDRVWHFLATRSSSGTYQAPHVTQMHAVEAAKPAVETMVRRSILNQSGMSHRWNT